MLDLGIWAAVPYHFWSVVFFVFGAIVGSFLNVCIHRMPRGESLISPPSHCPHCQHAIPWYFNIPLATWLWLRAKCAHCKEPISSRYFLVELLTALAFLAAWLAFGQRSPLLALAACLVLAGFIVATFIDFEHFIIPDEITLGGIAAGFLISAAVPLLHNTTDPVVAMQRSFAGIVIGGGIVYAILRLGKLMFGRHRIALPDQTKIIFGEEGIEMPDQKIPYEDLFYRKTDTIIFHASRIELPDRCYFNVAVRLNATLLDINGDRFNPEEIPRMEAVTAELTVPREAMGLGDVKFMAGIGAFIGWSGALFSLMASALLGSVVGIALILAGRQEWSGRIPYGPYIAVAATVWIFFGPRILEAWRAFLMP